MLVKINGQLIDVDAQLREIDKWYCEHSLSEFIKRAWHVVETAEPYQHGWHIDYICEHLEAITDGYVLDDGTFYNRVLFNVPPGMLKSLILNVFWPAWEWGPKNMPYMRYVCAAHKIENLSERDARRMRNLITSDWYVERWGDRVKISKDQNEKLNFVNSAQGFRIATAITSLTGIRGDRVIIDDPHSVDSAASAATRTTEVNTFLEAIPTRLNNPEKSAIVVIMQRLHEQDVSGVIIDKKLGYDHICLPMRYDPSRAHVTKLGMFDPREEDGELLFPARFPLYVVERDEKVLGPYGASAQFQQSPKPRGGGIIKDEWWQVWDGEVYPPMDFIIASLDTAYTVKQENDPSALTIWGVWSQSMNDDGRIVERLPKLMLIHAWAERLELHDLVRKVAKSCTVHGVDKLIIEDKAAGHSVAQELRRVFGIERFGVQLVNPGAIDKVARLHSIVPIFSEGMVYAPNKHWAQQVIDQCATVPKAVHDDLADTTSQGIRHLRDIGLLTRSAERNYELEEMSTHRGAPPVPLYGGI